MHIYIVYICIITGGTYGGKDNQRKTTNVTTPVLHWMRIEDGHGKCKTRLLTGKVAPLGPRTCTQA